MKRVIGMGKPLMIAGSVTYAMKGRDLLRRHGIEAYVERVPHSLGMGCGYGIFVKRRSGDASALLREVGLVGRGGGGVR